MKEEEGWCQGEGEEDPGLRKQKEDGRQQRLGEMIKKQRQESRDGAHRKGRKCGCIFKGPINRLFSCLLGT